MYTENMKRKVAKVAPLRLSPNEEALILKQERERRRKLRLQQVREQEKFIAQQIRQDVKERRDVQLQNLAEELRVKWEEEQEEKLRALEEVYLSALNAIGEGHRQAKENEPDLKAIERTQALNKEKAERRHREALKELHQHRQKQLRDQTWHITSRQKALHIEKERAAKVASLPPPPPDPLENLEVVKRAPLVKLCNVDSFSVSHYHLPEAYVDREMDTEQPDARSAAVEEAKRLDALQKEEERDRLEQMEKATLRGSYALKMVQLTQDRERLMEELEHMQQEDLARRRHIVSQMPPQLFEPAYRRAEIQEDWQRDLESAFEDMYTRGTKMKGDLILHLKPQPLPDPGADGDLDLSVEPEAVPEIVPIPEGAEQTHQSDAQPECRGPQSRQVLKRLLNRIRTQQDQWSAKSEEETGSETLESGSLPMEDAAQTPVEHEEEETEEAETVTDNTVLAGNSVLLHPQEHADRIRTETDRKKKMDDLQRQKMEQLELLRRLEEERQALEEEYYKAQQEKQLNRSREMEERRRLEEYYRTQQEKHLFGSRETEEESSAAAEEESAKQESSVPVSEAGAPAETVHVQMIREYQHRLVEQNRLHKQSVDEARRRLQEYQLLLKKRYPHLSPQETMDRSPHSPKPQALEYPPSPPPANVTMSPVRNDSLRAPVTHRQNFVEEQEQKSPHTSVSIEPTPMSPRNEGSKFSPEQLPRSVVDFSKLASDIRNLQGLSASHRALEGEICPPEMLPQTHSSCQSPVGEETRLPHFASVGEKLSTSSSPGDYDTSSSTTYHPLPSELSLGLPQMDLSEPATLLPVQRKMEDQPLGDFSNVREFRERLLSSTMEIRAQQEHLKTMQDQLDEQRDSLLSKQKNQEEHLLYKQKQLEEQMRRHQESLENALSFREPGQNTLPAFSQIPRTERYDFMSTLLEALEDSSQEDIGPELDTGSDLSNSISIKPPWREQRWRSSKPPVTKTKLGPFLDQHELSAIMEVETPTSGRRSSTGLAESHVTGHVHVSGAAEVMGPTDDSHRKLDLSGLSSASLDRSNNESSNRSKLCWREMLSLEGSCDPRTADYMCSTTAPDFPADDGADPLYNLVAPPGMATFGIAVHGRSPDGIADSLSTTTISTGSFLTSEKTDGSPASFDALSELQRCDYSVIRDPGNVHSTPSAPTTVIQPDMKWRNYLTPPESRSHIQQIIAKYTRDLHVSLERSPTLHSLGAVDDTSTSDSRFPTTFYTLEAKPDFDASSYTASLPTIQDVGQGASGIGSQEHALQRSLPSSLHHSTGLRSHSSGLAVDSPQGFLEAAESSGHFLPLQPENTFNEVNMSRLNGTPYRTLAEGLDCINSAVSDRSQFFHINVDEESSIPVHGGLNNTSAPLTGHSATEEPKSFYKHVSTKTTINDSGLPLTSHSVTEEPGSFHELIATKTTINNSELALHTSPGHSVTEEPGSFHELIATKTTINDSSLSEHPISLDKSHSRSVRFEELPLVHKDNPTEEDSGTAGHCLTHFTKQGSSLLPRSEVTSNRDTALDSCDQTRESESHSLGSHSISSLNFLSSAIASSAGSLPSSYAWDSGSARGILEEPDLTLVSLNDSSVVCSERTITPFSLSGHQDKGEISQHSFKVLTAEVDESGVTLPERSSLGESLAQHFAEIDLEFTSTPGSLQDAFLKRKKHFIEKSSKRINEIKTKDRLPMTTTTLRSQQALCPAERQPSSDTSQAERSQLKKVVEVRVSTPEGRKLSDIEMHQRTTRLYNRLDEVKSRKEEKMRQEAYAKNRQKAKEFKKRTLEKLRAKK